MNQPAPLPRPLSGFPFSTADAIAEGVNPERLRRLDLRHPFRGVNVPANCARDLIGLCMALACRLPPDGVFSHLTAARLWGMPLPSRFDRDHRLHVATLPPHRSIRVAGTAGHKLDLALGETAELHGLSVTSAARTWRDLAPVMSIEDLIVVGDFLLWWRKPLATREELGDVVRRSAGGRGLLKMRLALPELSDRSDSPPESRFRYRFAQAGLPRAEPNRRLYRPDGTFLAMPDLVFYEYREVFDYEGDHHRTDDVQWEKDIRRVPRLERAGWHSNRGSKLDLRDSSELIARLARNLHDKGWRR